MPSIILLLNMPMVPVRLKVAMARRSLSASPGVKPPATMAIFIACSWNRGTPSVFLSTASSSSETYSTFSSFCRRRR
jgi:hypothetical protein